VSFLVQPMLVPASLSMCDVTSWVAVSEMWSKSGIWLAFCDCVVYYSLIYWLNGRGIVAGYFGSGNLGTLVPVGTSDARLSLWYLILAWVILLGCPFVWSCGFWFLVPVFWYGLKYLTLLTCFTWLVLVFLVAAGLCCSVGLYHPMICL
jgi:hypothetical protein